MYKTMRTCYCCGVKEVTASFKTSEQALRYATKDSSDGYSALCNKEVSYFGLCEECKHWDYFVHVHCQYCGDLVETKFYPTEEEALREYPDAEFKQTKATTKEAFCLSGDCGCKPTN